MTTDRPIRHAPASAYLRAAVVAVVTVGVLLRLRQYTFNRSLWYDEALLAGKVTGTDFTGLLDAVNGAPFAFLATAKTAVLALGQYDWAIRLVPLAAGLLSVELARRLANASFRSAAARIVFPALVACSAPLVFYSSEFKPYALDVAATLALLLLGARFEVRNPSSPASLRFALAGAAAVWFSWASVFVLAAVGATLAVEAFAARSRGAITHLVAIGGAWIASAAVMWIVSLSSLSGNAFLDSYWAAAYAPSPFADPEWYATNATALVHLAFGPGRPAGAQAISLPWAIVTSLGVLTAAGFACLATRAPRLFAFTIGSIAVTVAASALHAYPFSGRLVLFLVPAVFVALAALVDALASKARAASAALATLLIVLQLAQAVPVAITPFDWFDMKGALEFVRANRHDGDRLALSVWSKPAWNFYAGRFGLADMPVAIEIPAADPATAFLDEARRNGVQGRIWILFSHRFGERAAFFYTVDPSTRRIATWEGQAAGAYLVELPSPAAP